MKFPIFTFYVTFLDVQWCYIKDFCIFNNLKYFLICLSAWYISSLIFVDISPWCFFLFLLLFRIRFYSVKWLYVHAYRIFCSWTSGVSSVLQLPGFKFYIKPLNDKFYVQISNINSDATPISWLRLEFILSMLNFVTF